MLEDYCNKDFFSPFIPGWCKDIFILRPSEGFQPLPWPKAKEYFRSRDIKDRVDKVSFNTSYLQACKN